MWIISSRSDSRTVQRNQNVDESVERGIPLPLAPALSREAEVLEDQIYATSDVIIDLQDAIMDASIFNSIGISENSQQQFIDRYLKINVICSDELWLTANREAAFEASFTGNSRSAPSSFYVRLPA